MSRENRSTAKNVFICFLVTSIGFLLYTGSYKPVKTMVVIPKPTKSEQVTAKLVQETFRKRDTILKLLRGKIQHDSVFKMVTLAGPVQEAAQYKLQLEAAASQNTVLRDSLIAARKQIKAASQLAYNYKNKYLDFNSKPDTAKSDTANREPEVAQYRYNGQIKAVQFYRRKSILSAKISYIDLWSLDSNATINGYKTYEFERIEPHFGLRVQAITSYQLLNRKFQSGLGLAYSSGKFTFLNSDLYDLNWFNEKRPGRKFNFIFSTKFDIWKL